MILGFRVVVGLLNSSIFGFIISVCVIVICCCWLFESCSGYVLVLFVSCNVFRILMVCCLVCDFVIFVIFMGVFIRFFSMVICGYKWYC